MPKIQLNTSAPDFTLSDHQGKSISLSDFHGLNHILLVFNRGFL